MTSSSAIKKEIRENITREKKLLDIQKQDDLNNIKQSIEREKDDWKKKLQYEEIIGSSRKSFWIFRASMKSDMTVYKSSLEQQNNSYAQLRAMQEQLTKDKNELEEVRFTIDNDFIHLMIIVCLEIAEYGKST